jgi:filamentous hemagglutinin
LNTQQLDNQQNGTLYSAANLTLAIPDIRNGGLIASDGDLNLGADSRQLRQNPGRRAERQSHHAERRRPAAGNRMR